MKKLLISTAAILIIAGSATAGSLVEPEILPPPATQVNDWGGFYVGGMASADSGDITARTGVVIVNQADLISGPGYGAFVGYNIQKGAMVYGAELAYSSSDMVAGGFPNSIQAFYGDAKLRLGYSMGKAMVYGVAGYSFGSFDDAGTIFAQSGYVVGAGVDMMMSDHLFLGLEYTSRNIDGSVGGNSIESNIQSIAIRAGWNF